jgi:methyl-accepting chemotaxis protein
MAQLEQDVSLTLRLIRDTSAEARAKVRESVHLTQEIKASSAGLTSLSDSALRTTSNLVETARGLEVSSSEIGQAAEGADSLLEVARTVSLDVGDDMAALTQTVNAIATSVDSIRSIARQTNLLAINAAIEAVRSGGVDQSFSAVAQEVRRLAEEVQRAIAEISLQINGLEDAVSQSGEKFAHVHDLLDQAGPLLYGISQSAAAQTEEVRKAADQAIATADFADAVAVNAQSMHQLAEVVAYATNLAGAATDRTEATLDRLSSRSMYYFRERMQLDRRDADRFPILLNGRYDLDGVSHPVQVTELSTRGATLAPTAGLLPRGNAGVLTISEIGAISANVVGASELECSIQFLSTTPELQTGIAELLGRARSRTVKTAAKVDEMAEAVSRLFAKGIRRGLVRASDLLTDNYVLVPETAPPQYVTQATAFYDGMLQRLIDERRHELPEALFVVPLDRNSYAPVHFAEYSKPQRPNQLAWNDLNCRNRRIMVRSQTLQAARNTVQSRILLYVREMSDGTRSYCRLFCSPIWLGDALWGNLVCAIPMEEAAPMSMRRP